MEQEELPRRLARANSDLDVLASMSDAQLALLERHTDRAHLDGRQSEVDEAKARHPMKNGYAVFGGAAFGGIVALGFLLFMAGLILASALILF